VGLPFDYYHLVAKNGDLVALLKLPKNIIISSSGWSYLYYRYHEVLYNQEEKAHDGYWGTSTAITQPEFDTYKAFGFPEIELDYSLLNAKKIT